MLGANVIRLQKGFGFFQPLGIIVYGHHCDFWCKLCLIGSKNERTVAAA